MLPIWILFPALSPHDRYIDNIYMLPVSEEVSHQLANYNPPPEIVDFLADMRKGKEGLRWLPTTTLPSAHVAWAVLAIYYAYKADRRLLVIAAPLVIFSSLGTAMLAQHYLVDIPAGMATAIAAIYITEAIRQNTLSYSPSRI